MSTSQLVNNPAVNVPFPDLVLPDAILRVTIGPNAVAYALDGSLDRDAQAALYKQTLNDLVAGARRFEIQCSGAGYLDGHALETIKRLSQKILEVRGTLSFTGCSEDLAKLLELTHFNRLFTITRRPA
jgi:anti-anti-sigma regulatory factor